MRAHPPQVISSTLIKSVSYFLKEIILRSLALPQESSFLRTNFEWWSKIEMGKRSWKLTCLKLHHILENIIARWGKSFFVSNITRTTRIMLLQKHLNICWLLQNIICFYSVIFQILILITIPYRLNVQPWYKQKNCLGFRTYFFTNASRIKDCSFWV